MKIIQELVCLCMLICSVGVITIWRESKIASTKLDVIPWNNSTSNSTKENYGARFSCLTLKPSYYEQAQSVHYLTPYDVDIIAGIGDSATAGLGAGAKLFSAFPLDYRGLSWSAGGDKTLRSVTTLPNILKEYNPSLVGYSTGVSFVSSKNFNVAVSGVQTSHLIYQARSLVEKMDRLFGSRKVVDSNWKVITLMAGFNDICFSCGGNLQDHVASYLKNIKEVLEYLSANVKRAFINLAPAPDPVELKTKTRGLRCSLAHIIICPCLIVDVITGSLKQKLFGVYLEQLLVDKDHYNRDDFTVVLQPFFYNSQVPEIYDDYFGLDCSHLNEKGQGLAALYLWNNMLEPLGAKSDWVNWYNQPNFKCPSIKSPYFYTSLNSGNLSSLTSNSSAAAKRKKLHESNYSHDPGVHHSSSNQNFNIYLH